MKWSYLLYHFILEKSSFLQERNGIMRNPNGWGSITKLSGNRRKPWRVQKTDGWEYVDCIEKEWIDKTTKKVVTNPTVEQIALKKVIQRPKVVTNPSLEQIESNSVKIHRRYIEIGCFATKQEAMTALSDFNKDPFELRFASITFAELYDKWSDEHYNKINEKGASDYKAAFGLCSNIHNLKVQEIKLDHLQKVVDGSGKNTPTLRKVKVLFGLMFDYAVKHEIINKDKRDMVGYVDISKPGNPNAISRKPFSKKEINTVWKWKDSNEYFNIILMLIYTGVRISELLDLKKENVNLEEKWFDIIASKTESGIRTVPIAKKVLPFFEYWMNKNDCEYLLSTPDGEHFEYRNYYDSYWKPMMEQMNINHRPHDTRHTCVSLLAEAGVDERLVKKIVGHKGQGVTQTVYTHFDIDALVEAINKI